MKNPALFVFKTIKVTQTLSSNSLTEIKLRTYGYSSH